MSSLDMVSEETRFWTAYTTRPGRWLVRAGGFFVHWFSVGQGAAINSLRVTRCAPLLARQRSIANQIPSGCRFDEGVSKSILGVPPGVPVTRGYRNSLLGVPPGVGSTGGYRVIRGVPLYSAGWDREVRVALSAVAVADWDLVLLELPLTDSGQRYYSR